MTPAYTENAGLVEVVRRHTGSLIRFARRLVGSLDDAEEIVQEAFARAYEDRLRRARRPSPSPSAARTARRRGAGRTAKRPAGKQSELTNSVYKIAHNLSVDYLRRKRLRPIYSDQSALERRADPYQPTPEEALEDALDLEALRNAVREAVAGLPDSQRDVVALRFGLGLSYRECARQLHLGVGAIESRLHRAKKRLRHALKPWAGRFRSR